MKPTLFAAALFGAGAAYAAPPVITITTPAQFSGSKAVISGSATDTEESTGGTGTGGTGATVRGPGGVREVVFQYEGESKWRKTTLTAKGELTTTWIAEVSLKTGSTKRIYFMAVDKGGNDGAVVGRKFKRLKTGEGTDGGTTGNQPPSFSPANQNNAIGAVIDIQLSASDPNGDTVSYTGSGLPAGLTLASNGRITGTITETAAGTKTVSVTASDGKSGGATAKTFLWTITANALPVAPVIADKTNNVGESVDFSAATTDPNGDALAYVLDSQPPGITINAGTGRISGTITGGAQTYNTKVTVTDGKAGSVSTTFKWNVVQ